MSAAIKLSGVPKPPRVRLSKHRREVLRRLSRGEWLEVAPNGTVWLEPSGYIPGKRAIDRLVADEHVTRPVPAAPLFGLPAEPGTITDVGRVALDWALHGESSND
jgi:hypothetical protein